MIRNKLRVHEEVDEDGSWAISYGDMVTLLMSFFVIFFSTDYQSKKNNQLDQSLLSEIESMKDIDLKLMGAEQVDQFEQLSFDNVHIKKMDKDQYLIFFKGISFFESGNTEVKPSQLSVLKVFADKVLPYLSNFKILIYAYTDGQPVRDGHERYKDNIELSALRSISVLKHLFKLGIDKNRVEITGRGILPPAALNFMSIDQNDKELVKSMQRTVAFVLRRDAAK